MERIGVEQSHGASAHSLQALDESPSRKKKPKLVAYESSSSEDESPESVLEDDSSSSMVDSLGVPATKLIEMGCSLEQVARVVEICGRNTDIIEMFDFIQATSYDTLNERCTSDIPTLKGDSVEDQEDIDLTPFQKLKKMGFSSSSINNAVKTCESLDLEDLVSFLLQAGDDNSPYREDSQVEESGQDSRPHVDSFEVQEDIGLTPFQKLEKMGFSSSAINNAMETCESLDLEDLLSFLLEAEKDKLPFVEDLQVEESGKKSRVNGNFFEDEDVEFTPFQELEKMGFSSSAIKNSMEICESLNLEDLLSFLLDAEKDNLAFGEDLQVAESGEKSRVYEECPRAGSKVNHEAGPSRNMLTPVTWTQDKIRLWYTYLGLKQNFFTDPDAFVSAKNALKMKRCKKKSFELKSRRGELSKSFVPEKMMGFSIPGFSRGRPHPLPEMMAGPPYFYFENVAGAPKFEWETIKRHLHGVDVEYTDSKFFSATRRPRGYVHNIPIDNRKHTIPESPLTIFEALPSTEKYWPQWDTRDKVNCINTSRASDTLCEMIRSFFLEYEESEIPYVRQQEILLACKRWNLVWVGPGQAAALEPHEMELLLGYDKDHTRGCSSMTDRYIALGNSFQVNTVAYHLSPLKSLYPEGITVLSLFSGIGGAEVALHKSGTVLKAVVAVESNVKARSAIASWWKKSGQRGTLKQLDDVRDLTYEVLSGLIDELGKIDLIVGGSPCNNLSGCNRVSRVGLSGKESSLFFEFSRILNLVKIIMSDRGYI